MPKLVRAAVLVTGLVGLSVTALSATVAQDKGVMKKAAKKQGRIEVREGRDDRFRFFVVGGDGKVVAMSAGAGFETAKDAEKAAEEMRDLVAGASKVVMGKRHTDDEDHAPAKGKAKKDKDKADK